MKSGLKYLIESFYRSIVEGTSVPIPYREILLTARIMDTIFAQLDAQQREVVPGHLALQTADENGRPSSLHSTP